MNPKSLVNVGKTDLKITQFGLGTAPLGNMYVKIPREVALATVRYPFDNDINFVDTAPLYGQGLSEELVGTALADYPRESYIVATKVGRLIQPDGEVVFNFSRDGVLRSVEASLKRLNMDYVDILHIHDPDDHYAQALDEAFPTLAELRSQGVIKAVGSGMNQWQMLEKFARNANFDCFLLAGRYTLLEQTSLGFLKLCQEKNIAIFAGGVYNSGILASNLTPKARYNYQAAPPEILTRAQKLSDVCARHQVPLNVAAIQFPTAHPAITSLLVGAQNPKEVAENMAALQQDLPADLWAELKAEGLIEAEAPTPA